MTSNSSNVRRSLHDLVIPILRQRGYRGTWPVMSRRSRTGTEYVVFELAGGGEEVRIGLAADDRVDRWSDGKHDLPPDVEMTYLHPPHANGRGAWFTLADHGAKRLATSVLDALIEQGDDWWAKPGAQLNR